MSIAIGTLVTIPPFKQKLVVVGSDTSNVRVAYFDKADVLHVENLPLALFDTKAFASKSKKQKNPPRGGTKLKT